MKYGPSSWAVFLSGQHAGQQLARVACPVLRGGEDERARPPSDRRLVWVLCVRHNDHIAPQFVLLLLQGRIFQSARPH